MHSLLVTRDERVITEFQKIAPVTQTPLVIASVPTTETPMKYLFPNLKATATAGIAQ